MDPIVGVEINHDVVIYEFLKELVFLREHASSSSFVLKGGDEIEIAAKNVNMMGLVQNKPLEEIQKGGFFIRELGSINIAYYAMYIGANGVKYGSDGVA